MKELTIESPAKTAERAEGREYVGADCTLNGARAIIGGRQNAFATVAELDGPGRVEFAWQTVARVMKNGGRFKRMSSYPTEGARVAAETGKSKMRIVLEEAELGADESAVALYANYLLNTSPGYRPSDAAREAVRQYRADPQRVRLRPSGCAPQETAPCPTCRTPETVTAGQAARGEQCPVCVQRDCGVL